MHATSLPMTLFSAYVVTFATVALPNPSTVAASRVALTRGSRAAAAFLSSVVALDIVVFLVIAFGLQPLLHGVGGTKLLMPIAGVAMVVAGVVMVMTAPIAVRRMHIERAAPAPSPGRPSIQGPLLGGILVPSANPGFWIWWATVGTSFIHTAHQWGRPGVGLLLAAFLAGVISWYVPLVFALRRGRDVMSPRVLRWMLVVFGVAMVAFGLNLLWRIVAPL